MYACHAMANPPCKVCWLPLLFLFLSLPLPRLHRVAQLASLSNISRGKSQVYLPEQTYIAKLAGLPQYLSAGAKFDQKKGGNQVPTFFPTMQPLCVSANFDQKGVN